MRFLIKCPDLLIFKLLSTSPLVGALPTQFLNGCHCLQLCCQILKALICGTSLKFLISSQHFKFEIGTLILFPYGFCCSKIIEGLSVHYHTLIEFYFCIWLHWLFKFILSKKRHILLLCKEAVFPFIKLTERPFL